VNAAIDEMLMMRPPVLGRWGATAFQVCAQDVIPQLFGIRHGQIGCHPAHEACIVDEDIDSAELPEYSRHRCGNLVQLANIC
jgi:hypothetical protein